uniref:Uncharacterized protein n=1 Tax=Vitis vinifera TaxID=29760 RepID=A5BE04_VITVI|nr:hypothetical protein VITISV_032892 [Vitis vinifera]
MDVEVGKSTEPPEIFKERTLLIREALIFLNRLVSNPSYSTAVLRVLTSSRDVASLTIDIANRLSRVGQGHWQSDNAARQMRESEIVDLARNNFAPGTFSELHCEEAETSRLKRPFSSLDSTKCSRKLKFMSCAFGISPTG